MLEKEMNRTNIKSIKGEISYNMYGLKKMLEHEETRLIKLKQKIDESLSNAPEGKIRVSSTGNYPMFFYCTDESPKSRAIGKYITKEKRNIIKPLVQKEYDQKMERIVDKRIKQIQRLTANYYDQELEDI